MEKNRESPQAFELGPDPTSINGIADAVQFAKNGELDAECDIIERRVTDPIDALQLVKSAELTFEPQLPEGNGSAGREISRVD